MTIRLSSLRICLGAVALALCALMVCSAQAADRKRGRSIEISAPRSDEVTTNLNQLTSKKDSLKQLEEDLYKPLQSFGPKSSLEGVIAPPPPRPAPSILQSKRAKELQERRKNWMFMRPEDLMAEPTAEDLLKAPEFGKDGLEKSDPRSMEQYYKRLATKRPAANRPGQPKDEDLFGSVRKSNSPNEMNAHDDSMLPYGLKDSVEALKNKFDSDKGGDSAFRGWTRSTSSDPFGLGDHTRTREQELDHKRYMDAFRLQVDSAWQRPANASSLNPSLGFAATASSPKSLAAGFNTAPSPAPHHGLDAQNDVLHPLLGPVGLPDVNARAVGKFRPDLTLPTPPAPKKVDSTFLMPKRAF